MEGLFSVKSDVFSFGVLLLEIVSGKKNTNRSKEGESLLTYVCFSSATVQWHVCFGVYFSQNNLIYILFIYVLSVHLFYIIIRIGKDSL